MIKTGAQLVQEIKPTITEVTTEQLADALAQDIVVIDVREPGEVAEGKIAQAVNLPRGVLEMKLHLLPMCKDAEAPLETLNNYDIYLICRSGARSALAASSLQTMGFSSVKSVSGGMLAWQEQGRAVEK